MGRAGIKMEVFPDDLWRPWSGWRRRNVTAQKLEKSGLAILPSWDAHSVLTGVWGGLPCTELGPEPLRKVEIQIFFTLALQVLVR